MVEETLMEIEGSHDRATIASYFRQFAESLESGGSVTFSTDEDEVSLTVPEIAEFEIEVESETEDDETEYEIEFEVEWSTADQEDSEGATLEISSGTESQQETIEEAVDDEGSQDADTDSDEDQ